MASPTDLCCKSISQKLTHMRLASNIYDEDHSEEVISDMALYDSESDTSTIADKSHLSSQKKYFGSKSVAKMVKNYGDAFLAEKDTNMPLGSLITATAKTYQAIKATRATRVAIVTAQIPARTHRQLTQNCKAQVSLPVKFLEKSSWLIILGPPHLYVIEVPT